MRFTLFFPWDPRSSCPYSRSPVFYSPLTSPTHVHVGRSRPHVTLQALGSLLPHVFVVSMRDVNREQSSKQDLQCRLSFNSQFFLFSHAIYNLGYGSTRAHVALQLRSTYIHTTYHIYPQLLQYPFSRIGTPFFLSFPSLNAPELPQP